MSVQTVRQVYSVMEVLSQLLVGTVGHGIIVVEEQSIQHHRMVLLEGTVPQGTTVLEKHQILFHVRYVKKI